jgi:hypothetical protein
MARGLSVPAGEAAPPPISERPVRVEPKVVIAVAEAPFATNGANDAVASSVAEYDLIDLEADPPSSGAVPTPPIPRAPHAPSFATGANAVERPRFELVREAPSAARPLGEQRMPVSPSFSYSPPAAVVLRTERAFRARVIVIAVGAACALVGSAALFRAWQTSQPTPAAIVAPAARPVPVARPEPVVAPATATEPAIPSSEPAVVEHKTEEPAAVEPATQEAPAVAAKNRPAPIRDSVRSSEEEAEFTAPAHVNKPTASPAVQAPPPAAPPPARRPRDSTSDTAPSPIPAVRPRFDPTKI